MDNIKKQSNKRKKSEKALAIPQKVCYNRMVRMPERSIYAPLAQMDRAQASDAWCRRFESAMVRQEKSTAQAVLFSIQSEGLAWNLTAGEHDIAAGVWHHAPACISLRIDSIRLQASDSIRRFAPIPSTPSA